MPDRASRAALATPATAEAVDARTAAKARTAARPARNAGRSQAQPASGGERQVGERFGNPWLRDDRVADALQFMSTRSARFPALRRGGIATVMMTFSDDHLDITSSSSKAAPWCSSPP
jgi:hypothetical protein